MGVKSLWELLAPVGRPVPLETMEGKAMAIDSSIWIYQFQATMRDKEGRGLVNAPVLGFLRRITKLMFYGIKPVFVFDGGAPTLKRATLNERRKKKLGAAASHARVAEKLLAAQLRRKAVEDAQARQGKGKGRAEPAVIDEDTVYLEDLEPGGAPSPQKAPGKRTPGATPGKLPPNPISPTRPQFRDHDPYRLPEVDMAATIAAATGSGAPDPRLATEDELRAFIDEMKPEDFDVTSPEFRALPTELQYEIVGDLRLRSRQTSHKRLQQMLRGAPTALDFSRAQIAALGQRNTLTQQLLDVSGMSADVNISIPVRVASARNREYMLVRNEGPNGGWVLGRISDVGTEAKPIDVDVKSDDERPLVAGRPMERPVLEDESDEDDDDMEQVEVPVEIPMDPDLREFQRQNALEALERRAPRRYTNLGHSKNGHPLRSIPNRPLSATEDDRLPTLYLQDSDGEDDSDLLQVLEESRTAAEDDDLRSALELSRTELAQTSSQKPGESSRRTSSPMKPIVQATLEDDDDDLYASPTRLHTALSIAGAAPATLRKTSGPTMRKTSGPTMKTPTTSPNAIFPRLRRTSNSMAHDDGGFGVASSLLSGGSPSKPSSSTPARFTPLAAQVTTTDDDTFGAPSSLLSNALPSSRSTDVSLPQLLPTPHTPMAAKPRDTVLSTSIPSSATSMGPPELPASMILTPPTLDLNVDAEDSFDFGSAGSLLLGPSSSATLHVPSAPPKQTSIVDLAADSEDDAMEEVGVSGSMADNAPSLQTLKPAVPIIVDSGEDDMEGVEPPLAPLSEPTSPVVRVSRPAQSVNGRSQRGSPAPAPSGPATRDLSSDEEEGIPWSRSPSPFDATSTAAASSSRPKESTTIADWDAAQEMDAPGEENEFARFVAEVKGRDLRQVQAEIDDEIRVLYAQKRAALRDAEDVQGTTVAQIMTLLRLFGVPYMTAPMEAEAQCAALGALGLVDGVITDDSDVFLFGGARVFKNMFNQSRTVECFLARDLERELGLTRDTLVRLACLLGSDYIDGLPGVGPVVAMELLREFPGEDGLHKFRDWWTRVQMARDRPEESKSSFRKRFKKRFKETLFLTEDWPNPAVRDAYYHPTVDPSEEPFKWGLPDLDALRGFLHTELGWGAAKVDELLLPVIHRAARRGQEQSRQGQLGEFFGVDAGSGTAAPRRRQAYTSKRLQQVVSDFRRQQKEAGAGEGGEDEEEEAQEEVQEAPKKRKRVRKEKDPDAPAKKAARGRGRGRGRRRGSGRGSKRRPEEDAAEASDSVSSDAGDDSAFQDGGGVPDRPLEKTLRTRSRPKPKPAYKGAQAAQEDAE